MLVRFRKKGVITEQTVWNICFRDSGKCFEACGEGVIFLPRVIHVSTSKPKRVKEALKRFDCKDHNLLIDLDSFTGSSLTLYVTEEGLRRLGVDVQFKKKPGHKADGLAVKVYEVEEVFLNGTKVGERWEFKERREEVVIKEVKKVEVFSTEAKVEFIICNKDFQEISKEIEVSIHPDGRTFVIGVGGDEEWENRILAIPEVKRIVKETQKKLAEKFKVFKEETRREFEVDVSDCKNISEVIKRVREKYSLISDFLIEKLLFPEWRKEFPDWKKLYKMIKEKGKKYYYKLVERIDGDDDTDVFKVKPTATEEDVRVLKFLFHETGIYCDEGRDEDGNLILITGI